MDNRRVEHGHIRHVILLNQKADFGTAQNDSLCTTLFKAFDDLHIFMAGFIADIVLEQLCENDVMNDILTSFIRNQNIDIIIAIQLAFLEIEIHREFRAQQRNFIDAMALKILTYGINHMNEGNGNAFGDFCGNAVIRIARHINKISTRTFHGLCRLDQILRNARPVSLHKMFLSGALINRPQRNIDRIVTAETFIGFGIDRFISLYRGRPAYPRDHAYYLGSGNIFIGAQMLRILIKRAI